MCLEPFGATGLFILGRGARLLAAGVVTEKEEEEEEKRGGMGNRNRQRGAARRARAAAPGTSTAKLLPPEASREGAGPGQEREEKTDKGWQCTLPRVKVAQQFLKRLGK